MPCFWRKEKARAVGRAEPAGVFCFIMTQGQVIRRSITCEKAQKPEFSPIWQGAWEKMGTHVAAISSGAGRGSHKKGENVVNNLLK